MRVMHEASAVASRVVVRVRSSRRSCVALLATTVVFLAQPGAALNIVLNFESGKSDTFAADPGAANLTRIMQYVENYYEDVFEDSHTITINYWYDNITSRAGTLANHLEVSSSGGRETEADIRSTPSVERRRASARGGTTPRPRTILSST